MEYTGRRLLKMFVMKIKVVRILLGVEEEQIKNTNKVWGGLGTYYLF